MKILHTEASCGWGGQEIRILSEAQGLIERGHEVHLVCPAESRIFSEAARFGVPVVALQIGRKNLRGIFAMRKYLLREKFDVINTHSSTDAWLVALASRLIPSAPAMVRTRHISAPIGSNPGTHWLYTKATKRIATTGESLREELLKKLKIDPERIISIPTGVDTAHFIPSSGQGEQAENRSKLGLRNDVLVIGIVATLRSWKGHRFLIDAVAALPGDFQLVIVGDGPQAEALRKQVVRLGISNKVTFSGNQLDVVPWLKAFDIFVLPSYANEGVPQALMQAMACGLPCVTTNAGAISELAIDGSTALVVPPQDAVSLSRVLSQLAADGTLRRQLGVAARKHVEKCHGKNAMLNKMELFFSSVCAHHERHNSEIKR